MTHAQPLVPRPDQAAAVTALTAHLSPGGCGQLIAAWASGKTLIGRWTAAALDTRRALVVVPSLELIGQTLVIEFSARRPGSDSADQLASYGHASGRRFSTFMDQLFWAHQELLQTLRAVVATSICILRTSPASPTSPGSSSAPPAKVPKSRTRPYPRPMWTSANVLVG